MNNESERNANGLNNIMKLRKRIYMLESLNLQQKVQAKDSEMVEKIIKEIKRIVDEGEENQNVD